jgi:hypothetical protein
MTTAPAAPAAIRASMAVASSVMSPMVRCRGQTHGRAIRPAITKADG